jgi:hypothetical protein
MNLARKEQMLSERRTRIHTTREKVEKFGDLRRNAGTQTVSP